VLADMVAVGRQAGGLLDPDHVVEVLAIRERMGTTAVGKGVALPNARSASVVRPLVIVARSRRGIEWAAADRLPVTLVLMVLSPSEWSAEAHHALLSRMASAARLQRNRQKLIEAESFGAIAHVLREVGS
jgi:mannitol/fructose-specific phosphotransferase system IIA component (Ntr-type)